MRELKVNIYFCGMSDETFSEQIMIYKPHGSITRCFSEKTLQQSGIVYISDLLNHLKRDTYIKERLSKQSLDKLAVSKIYIQNHDCLLGLREDKPLSTVYNDFDAPCLEFACFFVAGASIHNETSYRFTIHPDEKIHEHMPHVHVSKGEVEIRYSLETLLPIDPLVNPHKRDNKKIITPFLKRNHKKLLELWNYYTRGYSVPQITQEGQQFYAES